MWFFPTSVLAKTLTWIVAAIVLAAVGTGAGFAAGYEYRGSPASAAASSTLYVLAAGSLSTTFPRLATLLVNETPGVSAPASTQTYEGSLDVVNAVSALGTKADVAAVADYRLIPQSLEPRYAGYEVVFGKTPEVLVYNASLSEFQGINSSNWGWMLVNATSSAGVAPFAVWNASTDPNGYNEIFSLELQGSIYNGSNLSVYSHFYSGAPWTLAKPNPSTTRSEKESLAAELIAKGTVSALITYRSYAVANHLSFVTLNQTVGLNATDPGSRAQYGNLSTEIETSLTTTARVRAAPVLFAVTVPTDAPNPALGAAFIHLLLSPQGDALIGAKGGFTPFLPGWIQPATTVPPVLAPDVTTMPLWASALLA